MNLFQATAAAMADQGSVSGASGLDPTLWEHRTRLSEDASDAVDSYFQCITTCSLEDGECITRCVEQLREVG
jgi:hypothetical protein